LSDLRVEDVIGMPQPKTGNAAFQAGAVGQKRAGLTKELRLEDDLKGR
jgi:hypothetical protein